MPLPFPLEFVSVGEARRLVLDRFRLQPSERAPFAETVGRTLAAPVVSRSDVPPFDNSAMDGYAVRTPDLAQSPTVLRVIEDIPAGQAPQRRVTAGTCARIMTGAPFPEGADAVAPVEWTTPVEDAPDRVRVERAPTPGQHVRPAGEDVRAGETVFEAGTVVVPPGVGMLATLGYAEVDVRVRPAVAVISTGDELVGVADEPGPGQIRNANGPALAAQVVSAGGRVVGPFTARDDLDDLRACVDRALTADVLLFSGGVSVGEYDFVKQVLDERGMQLLFWKVRQRPGKPLAFGLLEGKPVFGLPGNPVSSAVCFEQYVRPALARALGRPAPVRPLYPAVLEEGIVKKAGLHHFVRGRTRFGDDGRLRVRTTGAQGSNLYGSFAFADCLIHLPEALENPAAGDLVQIEWLRW